MKLYRAPKQKLHQDKSLPWHAALVVLAFLVGDIITPGSQSWLSQMLMAAQYYVDYSLGLDTNNGTAWATPMKTLDQITKNLNNGDWVYCAESPDPTSIGNATWTAGDRTVTLATACAALMYACDGATTGYKWLPSASVTTSQSTTMKEGTHSAFLSVDATFTTGVIATANLGADLNCSSYQQISFWVRANAAVTANCLALAMYSDDYPTAALTNLTGKAYIPSIPAANLWQPVTVDYGGALGTVRTIALIAETHPGWRTGVGINIDDILACKAPTEADSLTLTSLISKNTAGEPWFAIGAITGTPAVTVELESINAAPSSTIGSYGGTTDVSPVETFKRECFATTPVAAAATAVQTINDSGAAGAPIVIAGGYQNGADVTVAPTGSNLTIYQGSNGNGYGIYATGRSYVSLSRLGTARYNYGFYLTGTQTGIAVNDCYGIGTTSSSIYFGAVLSACSISRFYSTAATSVGFNLNQGNGDTTIFAVTDCVIHGSGGACGYQVTNCTLVTFDGCTAAACANYGFHIGWGTYGPCYFVDCVSDGKSIGSHGFSFTGGSRWPLNLYNCSTTGHTTAGLRNVNPTDIYCRDTSIAETVEAAGFVNYGGVVYSTNHDDSAGSHYKWEYGATYNSQQSVRHTESGWAWQLSPTNAARSSTWPLRLPIGQVYLAAGTSCTVTCWMQRSNTGLSGGLVCPGGQLAGLASDVSDTSWTVAAGEWEQQSITLSTQTEAGMVSIEAQAWDGSTYSLYVDDLDATPAAPTGTLTGLDAGDGSGPAYINAPAGGGGTRVTGGGY